MRHFQIEHSALDCIHEFVQTCLCMGLPMKICTHEGVWPSQYTILEKLKHILSTSNIAIHALLMYWQFICHFSLYTIFLLWLTYFDSSLKIFVKTFHCVMIQALQHLLGLTWGLCNLTKVLWGLNSQFKWYVIEMVCTNFSTCCNKNLVFYTHIDVQENS